jgi:DNA-binding CsgD family transcriptional regulator
MRLRGQARELKRLFDVSPVPMVMCDNERRHVEVNRPARLALRLTRAELRSYAADDLTPSENLPILRESWARMLDTGCVAGPYQVAAPDGARFDVVYCAVAHALPGLHVSVFAPADWPEDELWAFERDDAGPPVTPLSPREREVLQLAAEGLSGPVIAARLTVSPGTIKTHFANIYEKLEVGDRAAAVARGLRLGFIE